MTTMESHQHPCEGRTKAEMAAFDRVAAGSPPKCSAQTLANLAEAGLIERHTVVIARDRLGPVVRYEYSVPIGAHIQWCEWMTRPKHRAKCRAAPTQQAAEDLPLFAGRSATK